MALQLSGWKLNGLLVMDFVDGWMKLSTVGLTCFFFGFDRLQGHSLLRRKVKVELWTEGDLGACAKRACVILDHVS